MSGKKKSGRKRYARKPHQAARAGVSPGRKSQIKVRRLEGKNEWQLVHPSCACEREDDLEEVQQMLDAGELDIALDELRWLLDGCGDLVKAHRLLGEIALEQGNVPLARGHFGYAYDICRWALPAEGLPGPLPYRLRENQALHEAAKGLAHCLHALGKEATACQVLEDMLRWDPSDPLGVTAQLADWRRKS